MKTDLLRLLALLIDSLFVAFFANLLLSLALDKPEINLVYRFELVCFLAYFIIFDLRNDGQTLGKILFKIKPNDKQLKQRISRSFLKTISIVIFPITIIIYLFKEKILHDMLEQKQESLQA